MGQLLPYLTVAGAFAAVVGFFTWPAASVRRRGLAGSGFRAAVASYEEAFRITAHDAHYEIQAQAEAKSPMGAPSDPRCPSRDTAGSPADANPRPLQPRPRPHHWSRSLRRRFGLRRRSH